MDETTVGAASSIERAMRDVFEKRYAGRVMTYEQARELVWLERELVDHTVFELGAE